MSKCIAYFSKKGNTHNLVQVLAKKVDAEIIRLEDSSNYKGIFGFMKAGYRAVTKKTVPVSEQVFNKIESFDEIYLATPVWADNTTPVINAVLEGVDFTDKKVYIVTTQTDPKFSGQSKRLAFYTDVISKKGGQLIKLYSFQGSTLTGEPFSQDKYEVLVNERFDK